MVADYRTSNLLILRRPAAEKPSPEQEVGSSNLPGRATFLLNPNAFLRFPFLPISSYRFWDRVGIDVHRGLKIRVSKYRLRRL